MLSALEMGLMCEEVAFWSTFGTFPSKVPPRSGSFLINDTWLFRKFWNVSQLWCGVSMLMGDGHRKEFHFLTGFLKNTILFSPHSPFPRGHATHTHCSLYLGETSKGGCYEIFCISHSFTSTYVNNFLHFVQKGNNDLVSYEYSGGLAKSSSEPYKLEEGARKGQRVMGFQHFLLFPSILGWDKGSRTL